MLYWRIVHRTVTQSRLLAEIFTEVSVPPPTSGSPGFEPAGSTVTQNVVEFQPKFDRKGELSPGGDWTAQTEHMHEDDDASSRTGRFIMDQHRLSKVCFDNPKNKAHFDQMMHFCNAI